MTAFVLACLGMVAVIAALLAYPLFKRSETAATPTRRWVTLGITVIVIAAASAGIYVKSTQWSWTGHNPVAPAGSPADVDAMVAKLEQRLKEQPNDAEGWLWLGRAYVGTQRYEPAVMAYQRAYDLTQGQNIDATIGLAEAMVLADETALTGRAAQLFEQALQQQPQHPKALWYGGLAALKTENLPLARQRFAALLALNPPEQIRGLLQREVQDIDQQLGKPAAAVVNDPTAHKLVVHVRLADSLKQQLNGPITLFVLARDPQQGGPPLAVVRQQSSDLPLTVELTKANAMLPTRNLDTVEHVEVVARLSRSGTPQEQSGDYMGSVQYAFSKGKQGTVNIEINRQVP